MTFVIVTFDGICCKLILRKWRFLMYKICSQFLIVLSCVMLMVVSLQVDYVMIACILTGIIVCTFIDMQDVPQMSPANKSETADRAFDLILAVYILSGVFLHHHFLCCRMQRWYSGRKIHGVEDGCSRSGDSCIGGLYFKDKHIAPGILISWRLYFSWLLR